MSRDHVIITASCKQPSPIFAARFSSSSSILQSHPAAMSDKRMRPIVKLEPGGGDAQEQQAAAAATGGSRQRRRGDVGEAALEFAMQGMERERALAEQLLQAKEELVRAKEELLQRERAMGEELLQAKAQVAELRAEIRIRDAVHQAQLEAKDAVHKAEVAVLESKLQPSAAVPVSAPAPVSMSREQRRERCVIASSQRRHAAARVGSECYATEDAEIFFQEGLRLYGEQRFSEAAERWGRAALLQHAPSHAHLSSMLFEGRHDVPVDVMRAFKLAMDGAALGCAHSKGVVGRCYVLGAGVQPANVAKGLALGRESQAAGSCFGQYCVAMCHGEGWGVGRNYVEAARLYRLAAAQGCALAQNDLAALYENGTGIGKDEAEAARLYSLAAGQGLATAQFNLGTMFESGEGVAQDDAEAVRLYRLAAAQGHAVARNNMGFMYEEGYGVAQDRAEAIRWYRLAAAQGVGTATAALKRLRA